MRSNRQFHSLSCTEISPAQLRSEADKCKHSYITTKLLALADVVEGEKCANVSKKYSVSTSTIYYWIRCFNDRGIKGLVQSPGRGRRCHLDSRHGIGYEALVSAAVGVDRQSSKRLIAISQLFRKVPCVEVARNARVTPSTLSSWIKRFNAAGIAGLVSTSRKRARTIVVMRTDIAGAEVRGAARNAPRLTSRRLMAVADVLDGKKLAEVAVPLDISISSVSKWCRRFNEGGIEGLVYRWEAKAANASMMADTRSRSPIAGQ